MFKFFTQFFKKKVVPTPPQFVKPEYSTPVTYSTTKQDTKTNGNNGT